MLSHSFSFRYRGIVAQRRLALARGPLRLLSACVLSCGTAAAIVTAPASARSETLAENRAPAQHLTDEALENARAYAQGAERVQRVLRAVLGEADPKTGLVPDHFHTVEPENRSLRKLNRNRYSPHNSAADLYPYLVLGAHFVEPELVDTTLLEMLRNEVRYTAVRRGVPGNFDLRTGRLHRYSLFGAAEYAKDGLVPITEMLGRSPWYYRMHDMLIDVMDLAPVESRYGFLPGRDTELNGDMLQAFARLIPMSGDPRFREWGRRIADAYLFEVLPGSHDLPVQEWSFRKHEGHKKVQLRDHGNETIVGLTLLYALEKADNSDRAAPYELALEKMFDRLLASTNADGLFYNSIDSETLKPIDANLADSWGYVYSAVYNFYLLTGKERFREATIRTLRNIPRYAGYTWEGLHYDGIADSVEGAIYLVNREPIPEVQPWIESELLRMYAQQGLDGHVDGSYLEGNFIRTTLLSMLMRSRGVSLVHWRKGAGVGAVPTAAGLVLHIEGGSESSKDAWDGLVRFDSRRHRRNLNLRTNLVRVNEFPEWWTADENTVYTIARPDGSDRREYLGSELIRGVRLAAGKWSLEPAPEKAKPSSDDDGADH